MNTRKATAAHLAGLRYAYELWEAVEEANDALMDDEDAELISFETAIMQAISAAQNDAREAQQ